MPINFDNEKEIREIADAIGNGLTDQHRAYIGKPRDPDDSGGDVKAVSVTGLPNSYYIRLDSPDNPIFSYALADIFNQTQDFPYDSIVRVKPYYRNKLGEAVIWTILGADEMLVGEQFGAVGGDQADFYGGIGVHNHTSTTTGGTLDINTLVGVLATAYGGTGIDMPATILDDRALLAFNTVTQQVTAANLQFGGIVVGADTAAPSVLLATYDHTLLRSFDNGVFMEWQQIRNNYTNSAPTVADDASEKYAVGSWWFDGATSVLYICADPTDGAAVWEDTSGTIITDNLTAIIDPTISDDDTLGYSARSLWLNTARLTGWICFNAVTGGAVWKQVSGILPTAIRTIVSSATTTDFDQVLIVDATSGAVTVTLPTATAISGTVLDIKKSDSSTNTVTLDGDGANVDGAGTFVLIVQFQSARVIFDDTQWWVI